MTAVEGRKFLSMHGMTQQVLNKPHSNLMSMSFFFVFGEIGEIGAH